MTPFRLTLLLTMFLGGIGGLVALSSAAQPSPPHSDASTPTPIPWPMFHQNPYHTGWMEGKSNIRAPLGLVTRWQYRVFDEPPTDDDLTRTRWTASFPLGDLDGDGTLEVVVTSPDVVAPSVPRLNGQPVPDRVIVLKDAPGQSPPVQVLWVYTSSLAPGTTGLDTYSPALADADGDGLLDVIFTSRDGWVRALKGTTGQVLWEFNTDRRMEAGPMINFNQVIIVTDCASGAVCPTPGEQAHLFVLPLTGTGVITQPLWSLDYPYKLDSAEPAVAHLNLYDNPDYPVLVLGTWGGELLLAWRAPGGAVLTSTLPLRELDPTISISYTPVIRSSPLLVNWGEGPTLIFGWLPTDENASDARVSAVGITTHLNNTITFTNRWTISTYDVWKSSPALIPRYFPQGALPPLFVMGYGLGNQQPGQSGPVGQCVADYVTGGIVALTITGTVAWGHNFGNAEGNIRASPATADLDGDYWPEVVLPTGCYGKLHIYDGLTGAEEWTLQLGPRSQGSPSLGDLNADGNLEIVVGSYDGQVWVLDGGYHLVLPLIQR